MGVDLTAPALVATPVETYTTPAGVPILVKREDACCPWPGPPFSKMRGVLAHVATRPEAVIGVLDTFHSKAGWAVAYACQRLGKRCVNFWPRYKADPPYTVRAPQQQAQALGASLYPLPAGRSAILYHQARAILGRTADSYLMPNALKLRESVQENAIEATRTRQTMPGPVGTIVISISSGTVAAGVIAGWCEELADPLPTFICHQGYSRSAAACRRYIEGSAGVQLGSRLRFVDEGYAYADHVADPVPFPCSPYYDAKAWRWVCWPGVAEGLTGPVMLWNIGA